MAPTPTNQTYSAGTWELAYTIPAGQPPPILSAVSSSQSAGAAEVLIPQLYGLGLDSGWSSDEQVSGEILSPGAELMRDHGIRTAGGPVEVWVRSSGATISVGVARGV